MLIDYGLFKKRSRGEKNREKAKNTHIALEGIALYNSAKRRVRFAR